LPWPRWASHGITALKAVDQSQAAAAGPSWNANYLPFLSVDGTPVFSTDMARVVNRLCRLTSMAWSAMSDVIQPCEVCQEIAFRGLRSLNPTSGRLKQPRHVLRVPARGRRRPRGALYGGVLMVYGEAYRALEWASISLLLESVLESVTTCQRHSTLSLLLCASQNEVNASESDLNQVFAFCICTCLCGSWYTGCI